MGVPATTVAVPVGGASTNMLQGRLVDSAGQAADLAMMVGRETAYVVCQAQEASTVRLRISPDLKMTRADRPEWEQRAFGNIPSILRPGDAFTLDSQPVRISAVLFVNESGRPLVDSAFPKSDIVARHKAEATLALAPPVKQRRAGRIRDRLLGL